MRLFHVSEEADIKEFVPRIPYRKDVDRSKGLVWSLTEQQLPNWGTPRDCPRVCYRATDESTQDDIAAFFSSAFRHCVAIEYDWHHRMLDTALYIYEFDTANFYFDERAGFYVSDKTETPIAVTKHQDLYARLFKQNVEVRILENLWELGEKIQKSSLMWSLCRMHNAKPKHHP
jgi:hypothetical protein